MQDKKEVQQKIVDKSFVREKASLDELYSVLRTIAPGTHVRAGLDGIIKAGKGALIAVSNDWLVPLLDGGFKLNSRFSSQRLIELSKMDGAIILSKDLKRIVSANVLLSPHSKIHTKETGTRHKAAERTAKEAGTLVIAISERRNEITVFYKNLRYPLSDSGNILRKANEHIQIIEKQREMFDKSVVELNKLEMRNQESLGQALNTIQRGKIIEKLAGDLDKYIIELGKEGTLLKPRLKELVFGVVKETELIVKDYTEMDMKRSLFLLDEFDFENLFDKDSIAKSLGVSLGGSAIAKGWRVLSKTSLADSDVAIIIKEAESLGKAVHSPLHFYSPLIGDDKAKMFKEEIDFLKFHI